MNISLTPELEQFADVKVNSGMHTLVSKVNQAIDVGLTQLKAGHTVSAKDSYDKLKKKINKISRKK